MGLATALLGFGADPGAAKQVRAADFDAALLAAEITRAANLARKAEGLKMLKESSALDRAADLQAAYMALQFEPTHSNPLRGEQTPTERVAQVGLGAGDVAENAAKLPLLSETTHAPQTYRALATAFVDAWLASPGHRQNLLHPEFHFIGTATRSAKTTRGADVVFATQVFFVPAKVIPPEPGKTVYHPHSNDIKH